MSKFFSQIKIPSVRIAASVMLVVVAIRLWSHPYLEETEGWGVDVWAARQLPVKIEHPAPQPPTIKALIDDASFLEQKPGRQREILALWATQTHLYLHDQPDYNHDKAVEEIQSRVDTVASQLKIGTVTRDHVDLGKTGRSLFTWGVLILGVVATAEFVKLWLSKRKSS
jgi:hypothetical protein